MSRIRVVYHVRSEAALIEARAEAIAVEQSVEMPPAAISSPAVLRDIVGKVSGIEDLGRGSFEVRVDLAETTTGTDAGQLLNMLFGNTSLHEDVILHDVEIPDEMASRFGGPNHGVDGLRNMSGAEGRPMTCSALKPQGLSPQDLAILSRKLAAGGLDFIKDDHGLADQVYSPFVDRVKACAKAIRDSNKETGFRTNYVPNISGDLDKLRSQLAVVVGEGLLTVLIEPMIAGVSNFHQLVRDYPQIAFFVHPALAGAARIAPSLLLGKLFRMFGADATIYPNYGGRFSYTQETCKAIADEARLSWHNLKPCTPTPAGGMSLQRVPEILDFYGADTMLLIGGSLLSATEKLTEEAAAFAERVARHFEVQSHV